MCLEGRGEGREDNSGTVTENTREGVESGRIETKEGDMSRRQRLHTLVQGGRE